MTNRKSSILVVFLMFTLCLVGPLAFSSENKEDVVAMLAETYLASGQNEKAIAEYEKIIKDKPLDIKSRMVLARLLSWERRYGESIEQYQKIIEMEPSNTEALSGLAEVYVWRGDIESAKNCYEKLIATGEKGEDVLLSLAEILIWTGRYKDALGFIEEAEGKNVSFRSELLKAKALLYVGEYGRAEDTLKNIISEDTDEPEKKEAEILLADAYAYSERFKEAIGLYGKILNEGQDIKVKEKLADVLSWDKEYDRALDLYDKILEEKYDPKVHRQKARVLGWARRYGEAETEYKDLAARNDKKEFHLEAEAKKAYWLGRVKRAIRLYSEVIEIDPSNVEAMFDLSQIYSYQSMWAKAIAEYDRMLEINVTHFRAQEGKEKAVLISSHPSLASRYRYFEADSPGRDMDMRIHEFFSSMRVPLDEKLFMNVDYALRGRMYEDFNDTLENEGRIQVTWLEGPEWRAGGYYGFVEYNRGIDEITHLFGGDFSHRILDCGEYLFSYDREKLENNSEVIRRHFTRNSFRNMAIFDITERLKVGAKYMFASYSDGNFLNEPSLDILYNISLEPKNLSVRYRYTYREFDKKVTEYFSPKGFTSNVFTVNWRHFLNKEEIFFGANNIYYDLKYDMALDSQYIVGHKFSWEANWDITKRFNFNVRGSVMGSSAGVYEESEFEIGVKYYF